MKKKLLILGSQGMIGSAVFRAAKNNFDILSPSRNLLDLFNKEKVYDFFKKNKPYYVVNCAAKAGGIYANSTYPADFIYENLLIQNNVISASHIFKVKKLVFLGSSCIYPKNCKQPIKEDYLLSGPLEETNQYYAIAKIVGIKMIEAFNNQYSHKFISIMPTNVYGINDNFHLKNSHVIPALIEKIYYGFINNTKNVRLWGSGKALRDFLYVDDVASAVILLMNRCDKNNLINVGSGKEITINSLSKLIARIIGYNGKIIFDKAYPDGTPRKILDTSKLKKLGWKPIYNLNDGLKKTIKWYILNRNSVKRK